MTARPPGSLDAPPTHAAVPRGRPEAAAAIWTWREAGTEAVDFAALARRNRVRGALRGLAAAALGAGLLLLGLRTPATVVLTVAGVVTIAALVAPTSLYAALERGVAALGRWTGQGLGWVLLTPVFYLFFAPFGWLLRRGRRDRLQRSFDPEATSYWEPHEGLRVASDSYQRQF